MLWKILISSIIFFLITKSVLAISAPTQVSPTDGSSVTSSTLSWQSVSNSVQYKVIIDDESSISSPYVKDPYHTTNTQYSPQLSPGSYYWKVGAKDSSGSWFWSNIWSFTLSSTTSSPSPSPSSTSTSTFTISNVPSQIDSTQIFTTSVNLELSSYPSTKFYLKGAFAKSGSINYFGYTKVSGNWVKNGSTYSDQYEITTDSSGKWSGNLEIQIDPLDRGYEGTNDYIFKVGRYAVSSSGNTTGPIWSNETNIKINAKEIEDQGGLIDLSKLSSKDTPKVLGETKKEYEKLPESVYSLENYRRSATISSTPSASQTIEIKGDKQNLILPIIGGIFLGLGLGFGGYLIIKNRVKS